MPHFSRKSWITRFIGQPIIRKEHVLESNKGTVLKYWGVDFFESSKTFVLLFVLIRCNLPKKNTFCCPKGIRVYWMLLDLVSAKIAEISLNKIKGNFHEIAYRQ